MTLSVYDVTPLVVVGNNEVQIDVDPGSWINEIEVSTLTVVPEPASIVLISLGLCGVSVVARKRRRA